MMRIGVLRLACSALLVLVASVSCGMVAAGPARAALGSCGSSSTSYLEGAYSPMSTSIVGVAADIESNKPALCSASGGSPSLSTAWVMLTPGDSSTQWAQIGYMNLGADSPMVAQGWLPGFHYMTQWTRACNGSSGCRGLATRTWGDPGTATHRFEAFWRIQDGLIHLSIDGTSVEKMNRNVIAEWSDAWQGQFFGETKDWQTDVPGTNADRTRFNYIRRYDVGENPTFIERLTGDSATVPGNGNGSSRYHHVIGDASVGGKNLDIWTDPLN